MLVLRNITFPHILKQIRHSLKGKRCLSTERAWEEVRIPSPWGDVAGKWWGPQDTRPILGLHGWQDNSGTFDRLIPLLPPHVAFLAIDMPGHGLSARLPPGLFYHGIDMSILIRRIVQYFNWSKVSLVGHSLGAMHSFAYTMLFPENVDFLICLDGLYPLHHPKYKEPQGMANTVDAFLKYDALNSSGTEPPSYTFPQLEQLLHSGSEKSIAVETCKYILQRNIAPLKNNRDLFYFTRDSRLKVHPLLNWPLDNILKGAERITCPVFLSMGNNSPFLQIEETIFKIFDVIKKHNDNVEYHRIDGTHHLHLNNPENIASLIGAFLEKYDVTDRSIGDLENKRKAVL